MRTISQAHRPATATVPLTRRKFPYGFLFIPFGILTLTVFFTTMGRWVMSDEFVRTPNGPDDISTLSLTVIRVFEVASIVGAGAIVWIYLLRPLIRQRVLSNDGMLVISGFFLWVYDPVDNYFNNVFAYNTHFFNRGSWTNFIPGYETPGVNHMPEPLLFVGLGYVWWIFGAILLGTALLRWLNCRYPDQSEGGMWVRFLAIIFVIDFAVEFMFSVLEIWRYPGSPALGTLFSGKPYQFPIHEPLFVATFTMGCVMLRYYRDDRGRSVATRGIHDLKVTSWVKSLLSIVALSGAFFIVETVGYWFPFQLWALKADHYAPQPSYMRAGVCGEGTITACPNRVVPIPKRGSLTIPPDDPRLPESVRREQRSPE